MSHGRGWVNALQGGMTPATLRALLASSQEYIQGRAGGLDAPSYPTPVADPMPYDPPDPGSAEIPVSPDPVIIDPGATDPGTTDLGNPDTGIPDAGATDLTASDPGSDGGGDLGAGGDDCGC